MLKKITHFIGCLLLVSSLVQAQDAFKLPKPKVRCYTAEYLAELRKQNPSLETDAEFEAWLQPLIQIHKSTSSILPVKPYKMAIVFHVINSGEAVGDGTNVSQALINANILQLNKDYANLSSSSYAVATNTGLQFAMATTSPTGTVLAEPGIDRIDATAKGWTAQPWATSYINSTIKPTTIWDPTKYINIWIAPMSGGILGLATFPTSSGLTGLTGGETATTAGVIVDPSTVGSVFSPGGGCGSNTYNLGKTLTHELGHFFGLRHIWGDSQPACGTDYVADTPPSSNPHYGTFTHPNPDSACKTADQMFENYMDYSDDHQLNTFTALQVDRIQTVMLNSPRRKTLSSSGTAMYDVTGTDSLAFAECAGALTFLETGVSGTSFRYHDVNVVLNVDGGALDSITTVSVNSSGTAVQGEDYDILNPTISFKTGDATKAIKLRIYDNAKVDGDRNILLTFNINGSGLEYATGAQALLLTIMDDDNFIVGQNQINILNENFGTIGGTLPARWATASSTGYPNQFVIGTKGSAGGTGQCAYISNNITTKPITYTKGVSGVAIIATPTISGQNVKALGNLKFKYKVRGLAGADDAYTVYRVAYDTTKALNFFGSTSGTAGYGPYNGTTATLTGAPTLTPSSDMNNQRFRVYFYWETGTSTGGGNPGFNLDDVVFTATPFPVETSISSSYTFKVPMSSYNQFKSTKGNAIAALIDSTTSDIQAFKVSVVESGNTKKIITVNGLNYNRTSKFFILSDSTINNSVQYKVGFYLTAAEVSAFGANKNNLYIAHIADGVDRFGTLDNSNTTIVPTVVIDSTANQGYILYAATFTGLGSFTLLDTAIVLPVKLVEFNGNLVENTVKLNWKTAQELNNKGFAVERSIDGVSFQQIGWVNATNISSGSSYIFTDAKIDAGNKYYYRLKQTDVDNKYAYSQVIVITVEDTKKVYSIHPNPISDKIVIEKNNIASEKTDITIANASGKIIYRNSVMLTNQFTIESASWSKGVYMVKLNTSTSANTLKIVKE